MIRHLFDLLFGCTHDYYSWPMRLPGEFLPHVSCTDCGKRAVYDWQEMRPVWHSRISGLELLITKWMEGK